MEKQGVGDYFQLARLSVKNVLMGASAPVVLLSALVGLVLIALSFFFYGLTTILQEYVQRPGLAYVSVGGGLLLVLLVAWKVAAWRRHREIAQIKASLSETHQDLLNTIDIAAWVQKYPWGATSLAVGVGFAASSQTYLTDMLVPFGKAIAPLIAEMMLAQSVSQSEKEASC